MLPALRVGAARRTLRPHRLTILLSRPYRARKCLPGNLFLLSIDLLKIKQPVGRVVARPAGQREVEDDERRDDEERHRRERVAGAQLEPEVLAGERRDVAEIGGHVRSSAIRCVASAATRSGSWVATTSVRPRPPRASRARRRELGALVVERRVRLVEDDEVRLVEERPAEREPLRHPARVGRHPLMAGVPQAEPLEQHPDALAPLADAVEPAVQLEVLERGQLEIDKRLVPEEADAPAFHRDRERAARRRGKPGDQAQQGRLPGSFGPVTTSAPPGSISKETSRSTARWP